VQFRRSERGMWVPIGFLMSCTLLMIFSWALFLLPDLAWRGRDSNYPGIPVRDYIAQSNMFTLCVFGLIASAWVAWRKSEHRRALWLAVLALPFLANVLCVVPSRTALVIIPVLIVLFGWVSFGWRGAASAIAAALVLAVAAWSASPVLRQRVVMAVENVRDYRPTAERSGVGERLEYWRKSLGFISEAPWTGHGTGSILDLFRRAAVGQTGLAELAPANPHNQIFAVAIQWGLAGTLLLVAMWAAHLMLFRAPGLTAWIGLMIVVQNITGSLFNSHLFDFVQGWAYVWGVGVFGGMVLRGQRDLTRNST
jgi:O-antigen ligase